MKRILINLDNTLRISPMIIGLFFGIIILLRNVISSHYFLIHFCRIQIYISFGERIFSHFLYLSLVTFPYPLLNALTNTFNSPYFFLSLQALITAAAGGFLFIFWENALD